jgi:hypothetical protein
MRSRQTAGLPAALFWTPVCHRLAPDVIRWHQTGMQIRTHQTDQMVSEATYSDCGAYRYRLKRRWSDAGGLVNFVMLNPSKADEIRNDPTVERCERRARRLGFAAFCVTNIFAWRDTDPHAMRRAPCPMGPENDAVLLREAQDADQVIVAWGAHGVHLNRGPEVAKMFRTAGISMHHLGLSKHGHPRHPLYLPYDRPPILWA